MSTTCYDKLLIEWYRVNIIQLFVAQQTASDVAVAEWEEKNSAISKTDCSCRTFDNSLNRMIRANIVQQSSTWIFRDGYCSSPQGHSKQLSVAGRIHWVLKLKGGKPFRRRQSPISTWLAWVVGVFNSARLVHMGESSCDQLRHLVHLTTPANKHVCSPSLTPSWLKKFCKSRNGEPWASSSIYMAASLSSFLCDRKEGLQFRWLILFHF